MFGLPSWLLIIPVLGFLILIHELGHFITAKWFGIKVTEFGIGFPPRLFGIRKNETIYSINMIPLGGFVKMVGEEDPTHPKSFARQSILKRCIVLSAGSIVNLLFPLVVFTILFMMPQDTMIGSVLITGVAPRSPASDSGLRSGDIIISIDDHTVVNHFDLIQKVATKLNSPVQLLVRRGGIVSGLTTSPEFAVTETITLVPRLNPPNLRVVDKVKDPANEVSLKEARRYNAQLNVGDVMTQAAIGVMIGTTNARIIRLSHPLWQSIRLSISQVLDVLIITKNGIESWIAGGPDPGFTGPVGMAQVTGEAAKAGISPTLKFMALISISLGIVNILPIPALDGGRLLFVMIECVRGGKRISPQRESIVHLIGFVFLISLIVFISYRDILRLLNGDSFLR